MNSSDNWNADLYAGKHSFVWKLSSSLIDTLAPKAGERILDIGCGTGQLTAKIAESGAEVIGIDQSANMLEEARRLFPHLQFDQKDAHDFGYAESFDAVFSNATFHWIKQPEKVIHCIQQVLKPNGRLVVEFGGKGNVHHLVASMESASHSLFGEPISHPWYFPSISEFSSLLDQSGLEVTQAMLFDRPTPLEGEEGLRNWIKMFGTHWLSQISSTQHPEFFELVENYARSYLFQQGQWYADYRRLRVTAHRQ